MRRAIQLLTIVAASWIIGRNTYRRSTMPPHNVGDDINNWDEYGPLTPTRLGLADLALIDEWDEVGTNQMRSNLTSIRFARLQAFRAQLEEIRNLPVAA